MKTLRAFIHSGLPDCKKYRPMCWKLLFNYLPLKKELRAEHLARQRKNYQNLINEMVIPPGFKKIDLSVDHPLSDGRASFHVISIDTRINSPQAPTQPGALSSKTTRLSSCKSTATCGGSCPTSRSSKSRPSSPAK